jgi:dCMP deaminase|tara:strand:- start:819 stop:1277 length:459 start_codon:yes stop_codon:yes gene_type:complete
MNKWDYRFIKLAKEIASWSKDPSTKVGAIAVNDKRIIATGYNGFPKGIEDSNNRLSDRNTKLAFMVHAEKNLIYNATSHGVCLKNSTVYIYGLPCCSECFKGLIQVGIIRVVMPNIVIHGNKWKEGCNFAKDSMVNVGIEINEYNMYELPEE